MATGSISQIKLPNGSTYALKDADLRTQVGVLSGDGSDVIGVSENYFRPTVKIFDAAPVRTDLSVVKLSVEDYADLVAGDALLSDVLYVVEGSYTDVFGQQVKNVAPGTDLSDAVNVEQLLSAVGNVQVPTDLSAFSNSPGYLVSSDISDYYQKSETSSAIQIAVAIDSIRNMISSAMTSTYEYTQHEIGEQ